MTEVPEHLLARSRARRAALGLGGDGGGESAPAPAEAATPDTTAAATPAPAAAAAPAAPQEAAPPPPPPPYVEAALRRKRVPVWAVPVLAFLPVGAVIYAQSLTQPPSTELTQLEAGAAVFANCQGCHGSAGGGGTGRQLSECQVVQTFPYIEEQIAFVKGGTAAVAGQVYGDPDREGGAHVGGSFGNMPAFASLSDAELLEVVRHERETLSGEAVPADELDAGGERLWPNGEPMLDANGILIDPEGNPLLNEDGTLANPEATVSAGGEKAECG